MSYDLDVIKDAIQEGSAQLLDVREEEEWDSGHLADATLVPLSLLRDGECPEELNRDLTTYIHCRSGRRVLEAAPLLKQIGFSNVVPLEEGFESLLAEGFRMGS
jgi:phage shock protein E